MRFPSFQPARSSHQPPPGGARAGGTHAGGTHAGGGREGRALVECIVAALLLAVTVLALAAMTRGTLALADDASLIARAQALATTHVEDALAGACSAAPTGADDQPRIGLRWQGVPAPGSLALHLQVVLQRTPLAWNGSVPIAFGIEAGSVCN